jgi:hypothetical protein
MKERILVLQSVNDQITRFREIRIKQSPFLQNYEFKYVYIIKLTSNDKRNKQTIEKAIERALNTSLDEKELTRRLKLEILRFNPNYLIVHAGMGFLRFTGQILNSLMAIKADHPNLIIGLERHRWHNTNMQLPPIFDMSQKTVKLIEEIF